MFFFSSTSLPIKPLPQNTAAPFPTTDMYVEHRMLRASDGEEEEGRVRRCKSCGDAVTVLCSRLKLVANVGDAIACWS